MHLFNGEKSITLPLGKKEILHIWISIEDMVTSTLAQ